MRVSAPNRFGAYRRAKKWLLAEACKLVTDLAGDSDDRVLLPVLQSPAGDCGSVWTWCQEEKGDTSWAVMTWRSCAESSGSANGVGAFGTAADTLRPLPASKRLSSQDHLRPELS